MTPQSNGFMTQDQVLRRNGFLPQCIGIHGQPSGGKTELALSAPGPIAAVLVDRGHLAPMLNPNPPRTRTANVLWKIIDPPLAGMATKKEYEDYWYSIRDSCYAATRDSKVRSCLVDGDSDTWEIQRLAEFGKLTQIPSVLYTAVNAARRAYYARMKDTGKFLILTSKMTKEYQQVYGPNGQPEMNDKGQPKRTWSGRWERKGFDDLDYSLELSIECYRKDATYDADGNLTSAGEFCARLELCKPNRNMDGDEFSGADCNLPTILQAVYPHIPLKNWGY